MTTSLTPDESSAQAAREWVSFIADDGDTWLFDLTFFRSSYRCIYGQGCQGIETEPDPASNRGCCSYGAHFVDGNDLHHVMSVVATLDNEVWQNASLFPELGAPEANLDDLIETLTDVDEDGDRITRVVDGACVLLNGNDAPTGPGCALHFAAERAELDPMVWKPEVCWQVPLRVEHHVDDYDRHSHFVREWTRKDWGPDSGISWWCTETPEAYSGAETAAHSLRAEIGALAGESIADALIGYIEGSGQVVHLPMPTTRRHPR